MARRPISRRLKKISVIQREKKEKKKSFFSFWPLFHLLTCKGAGFKTCTASQQQAMEMF